MVWLVVTPKAATVISCLTKIYVLTQTTFGPEKSSPDESHTQKNSLEISFSFSSPDTQRPERIFHSSTHLLLYFSIRSKVAFDFDSVTMAPKSAKKSGDNINSRLALVMKSGKGELDRDMHTDLYRLISFCSQSLLDTSRPSRPSVTERPSSLSSPPTPPRSGRVSSSITPCLLRLLSTTSPATT